MVSKLSIGPSIQPGVVGGFGKVVTPEQVTKIQQSNMMNGQNSVSKGKQSLSEFGQTIKKKYPQYADMSDQELGSKMLKKYPVYTDMVSEDRTIGEQVRNVGEGLVSFAGGIPKAISETGILNKPVERLTQGVASGLSKITGKEFKVKENAPKFSQFAAGSQVGGAPSSPVARGISTAEGVLEAASGVGALKGAVTKYATKKGIQYIISSKGTQKQVAEAIAEGRVEPANTGIKKLLFGSKQNVIEKDAIKNAEKTIASEITKPAYNQPTVLYDQIDSLIKNKSDSVSKELKDINIGSFTKDKSTAYKSIEDGILNNSSVNKLMTPKEKMSLKTAIDAIKKSKTAGELREARKLLDLSTPDSVKKATSISSDILQYRNAIWKQTRNELNDLIEKSAEKYGKGGIKKTFKQMSELYQAQDNIISKAGQIVKGSEGILSPSNLRKAAIGGASLLGGGYILDKITK